MKKTHLTMTGYTGGQTPEKPETNDSGQSETNENEPNHSQIQSDVFLLEYPKLCNEPTNLEEVLELANQQVQDTVRQPEDVVPQPQDTAGQPERHTEVIKKSVPGEIEKESDVVFLEFLSEHEQKANEDMNKILNQINKSSISIKEKSKTSSYDDQSAKSNQQFMEEQIESADLIKQSISACGNDENSSGSQPSHKELLDVTKGFFKLPNEMVEEDIEAQKDAKESVVESQLVKQQDKDLSHLDAEYTGPVRSIFGPEPIRDCPNSLEELLSEKPRDFDVPDEFINFKNEPCILSDIIETQASAYEMQAKPTESQAETVPEAQSSYEPNYDIVIGSKEIVVEPKISSGDNMLQSTQSTKIEQPSVTGELTEPTQERYNDLKKLNEILKAGLECDDNDEPRKSDVQQDNPEAKASEPSPEETDETLLIGGQVVTPSRLLEYNQTNNQNGEAVNINNSRHLQIETSSRHSDPGTTDAGTRKAFKEEIKYLSGHPQFRYLDAVSSATNVQKNSGEETKDLPGGGKSGDGTLNVGTNISKVSQVGQVKSKVSLGVEYTSTSDSVLYQDSQITVRKPKHQESGISQLDNRSGNFDYEHRNVYGDLVERKRLVETGPVIKDGDDAAIGNKQTVIATSDHQKFDIREESEANIGDFTENSASIFDQTEMKKSATNQSQTKQDSNLELKIKEHESNMEQTSKMKVRVEFKELQNLENQKIESLLANEEAQNVKKMDEYVSKDKSDRNDVIRLTSSHAMRSPSSQLLRPLGSNIVAELSAGHLQEVNHPSVYSIYMQPNNANATQAQSETVGEFKLAQRPQRISNENIPLKSIKKSSGVNVADQSIDSVLNVPQTAPVVKRDSVGTPEISRTMKKGDISKPDPKVGVDIESTVSIKIDEKEKSPDKKINLEPEVHIKTSEITITVVGIVPKPPEFESKTVLPDTKISTSELKKKVSIIEAKKDDSETTFDSVLTGTKSDVSRIKIASEEKIVASILQLKLESSEVDVDTKAEQPPIKLKVSEPFSELLKQDSKSKLPEAIPIEQRGRVLTTPDTKRRLSKELFSRSRSGSMKKSSKAKSQSDQKDTSRDRKKSTTIGTRAVVLNDPGSIRRTKLKRFTEACSKFFHVNGWFKKPKSSK